MNPAERSAERFVEHLEGIDEADDVRTHNRTVDFTIGDRELWPRYGREDHIRAIRSSSVSFGGLTPHSDGAAQCSMPRTGGSIHLPPAPEELWDELKEEADFADGFAFVNGTFELGSLMPPPDGVCTPHLVITEEASVEELIEAVDEAFRLYREVYEGGERAIKKHPDRNT